MIPGADHRSPHPTAPEAHPFGDVARRTIAEDVHHLEAQLPGHRAGLGLGIEPDRHVTTALLQVEGVGVSLRTEADHGELLGEGSSLYDQAVQLVVREQKASTSFVQRHLKSGYNRAATIIEDMEGNGSVSAANHVGKREVLVTEGDGQ